MKDILRTIVEHIAFQIGSYLKSQKTLVTENLSNLQIFNDVEISFWYTQEDQMRAILITR